MSITSFALAALIVALPSVALAAEQKIECRAEGKSVSQMGGILLDATSVFTFTEVTDASGVRSLTDIVGNVQVDSGYESSDGESKYIGHFTIPSLTENVKFNPRVYHGYAQFKNFDATDTDESRESGMWGEFVLEKEKSDGTFAAHYIFQAGDHMGGTLHLSCRTLQ